MKNKRNLLGLGGLVLILAGFQYLGFILLILFVYLEYKSRNIDKKNTEYKDTDYNSSTQSSQTDSQLLNNKALYAINDQNYELADELLKESIEKADNPIDLHFAYNSMIKSLYKRRKKDGFYIEQCIDYCKKDIDLYENKLKDLPFFKDNNTRIPAYQRLAIIYEKQNKYIYAVDITKRAIKNNMRSTTKGGFEKRLERLGKKD